MAKIPVFNINEGMKNLTVEVKVKGIKKLKIKLVIAKFLIIIATKILGCKHKFIEEEK